MSLYVRLELVRFRAVATSTVGPVSTGPLFGAPKLFLAHITIGSTTAKAVGRYVFSYKASKSM